MTVLPSGRDVGVVIVAGGTSSRAGGGAELKQFRWVAGKPMLLHSLQTFMADPAVCSVVCVLPRDYVSDPPPWIFQCDVDRLMISLGGRTRQESAMNGLDDLPDEAGIVLIHDAARPFVTAETVRSVIENVRRTGGGVVPAVPVVDTIKEAGADGRVLRTVERDRLWQAQTPQGFPREMIVRAHGEAKAKQVSASDDAGLCELLGEPILVVPGSRRAMKVTHDADFAIAEALHAAPE